MEAIFSEPKQSNLFSPSRQPFFLSQQFQSPPPPPPPYLESNDYDLNSKVTPSLLLIIVILAMIFFISGLVHLLVRFLLRPPNRNPEDSDSVTAFQGQLQQLFHLHDSGVDQSFIDTLPIFHYKAIIGLKDPFDCAVCLCEFECEDKLRLLPKCSHAFHMECIDTWLLSHSTCPLCRASLLPDFSPNNSCSPFVFVLESGSSGSSREILPGRDSANSHLGFCENDEFGSTRIEFSRKSCENPLNDDKVVVVKLGKFKNVDDNANGCENNADARRCFSMGSFEYVMDDKSSLQVPIRTPLKKKKQLIKKLTPGHRLAMSECGFDSFRCLEVNNGANVHAIERVPVSSSRRAFSFRFAASSSENLKMKNVDRRSKSEIGIGRWENGASEIDQSCGEKTPSFARKTLLWIVGRQNKVVHSCPGPDAV